MKIGTEREALSAERETVVTIVVVRRIDAAAIEVEVVSVVSVRVCRTRPGVAIDASVPHITVVQVNVAAAHEAFRKSSDTLQSLTVETMIGRLK